MPSRVLVCDWDETITVKDTTALMAQTAYINKQGLPAFDRFVRIHTAAALALGAKNWPRISIADEIAYQRHARPVEMASIDAIERAQIFRGLTHAQFAAQALQIDLRPGFEAAMVLVKASRCPIYILSVNWSTTLIEATLALHGITGIEVIANELEVDSLGVTTGRFDHRREIRTGADKMDELNRIRRANKGCTIVYIGDSSGDVLPLRVADTGVVMRGGRASDHFVPLGPLQNMLPGVFEGDWYDIARAWREPCSPAVNTT